MIEMYKKCEPICSLLTVNCHVCGLVGCGANALNLHKKYEKWQNIFWQDYNINPIWKRISRKKERRLAVRQWFSLLFDKDHNICGKYKGSVVIAYVLHAS